MDVLQLGLGARRLCEGSTGQSGQAAFHAPASVAGRRTGVASSGAAGERLPGVCLVAGVGSFPVLLFRARSRLCALPIVHVLETMRPLPIQALSGAPDFVLGISLIRGSATPVVDPGALIGATEEQGIGRFVTVRAGEGVVAIAVEGVLGIRELPPSSLRRLPPLLKQASAHSLEALGSLDAELLTVLKFARAVTERLWRSLESATEPA